MKHLARTNNTPAITGILRCYVILALSICPFLNVGRRELYVL
jgi:hypothetical protein